MKKSLITDINFVTPLVVLVIIFISTIFENEKKINCSILTVNHISLTHTYKRKCDVRK